MEIPLKTASVIIDDDDFDKVKDYEWYLNPNGYAITWYVIKKSNKKQSTKTISMHRIIMGLKTVDGRRAKVFIDHINGNKLDNRKSNLRECTISDNLANQPSRRASGHKGIDVRKCKNGTLRYLALISKNGKHYSLGTYNTEEEAALAYNIKAKELYGEFAYLNKVNITTLSPFIERRGPPYFGVKKNTLKKHNKITYTATLSFNKISYHLGTYDTEKEAAEAYNKKSIELNYKRRNIVT